MPLAPGSGFTLLFETLALTLAQAMPVAQVARLLGVGDARLWRVLESIVGTARAEESFAGVSRIGVEEKHTGRLGFISLFHNAVRHGGGCWASWARMSRRSRPSAPT